MAGALIARPAVAAEKQIRPFFGAALAGDTTFVDLEDASGKPHLVVGLNAALLGDVLGVEVDLGHSPGFFQAGDKHLVLRSRVTTLTGNIVLSLPRRLTEYTLRPYFVAGGGVLRSQIDDYFGVLGVNVLPVTNVGGGVTGFVTNFVGLCWDVRRFGTISRKPEAGVSFGAEQLSFWRASMALAIRY
ncbi:MAG: hypothetical protein A3F69_04065 [Acidobacteria bacterium RIFCSPLOWO2_12_FULL_66_10]|nr:MAG: hypothetical protein A3F69_04065 [Acidobacteria bacterium RIFCSPLOWO2_12_FULL_66_10]